MLGTTNQASFKEIVAVIFASRRARHGRNVYRHMSASPPASGARSAGLKAGEAYLEGNDA